MTYKFLIATIFRLYKNANYLWYDMQFNAYFRSHRASSSKSTRQHDENIDNRHKNDEKLVTINLLVYVTLV